MIRAGSRSAKFHTEIDGGCEPHYAYAGIIKTRCPRTGGRGFPAGARIVRIAVKYSHRELLGTKKGYATVFLARKRMRETKREREGEGESRNLRRAFP